MAESVARRMRVCEPRELRVPPLILRPILATGTTDAATLDATIKQWLAEADRYRLFWAI